MFQVRVAVIFFIQLSSAFIPTAHKFSTRLQMGWSDTWDDIIAGGNPRWKVSCEECHSKAFSHFQQHVEGDPSTISILCPLAGDDPFVSLLFRNGYSVTAIDLVPAPLEAMKETISKSSESWAKEESDGSIIWKHESGRATLIAGDAMQRRPELVNKFDAVYDKDSFGALGKQMRTGFCSRIAEYTKKGAIVYLECKVRPNHDDAKDIGPPFSLKEEDLMEEGSFGGFFDYVKGLGPVYEISMPMQQTGHILRRM